MLVIGDDVARTRVRDRLPRLRQSSQSLRANLPHVSLPTSRLGFGVVCRTKRTGYPRDSRHVRGGVTTPPLRLHPVIVAVGNAKMRGMCFRTLSRESMMATTDRLIRHSRRSSLADSTSKRILVRSARKDGPIRIHDRNR